MANPLKSGQMRLYTRCSPVWSLGTHALEVTQKVTGDDVISVGGQDVDSGNAETLIQVDPGATSQYTFEVTGPRLALQPAEILAAYPPPGSTEAADDFFPHVVLRRRTLPWERLLFSA